MGEPEQSKAKAAQVDTGLGRVEDFVLNGSCQHSRQERMKAKLDDKNGTKSEPRGIWRARGEKVSSQS